MMQRGRHLGALTLVAVGIFLLTYLSQAAATQQSGEINGVVTDEFANLIAGANIRLYSLDRILQTKSDASGHFRLSSVPVGTYELEVTKGSFKTKTIDQVMVSGSLLSYDLSLKIDVAGACGPLDSVSYEHETPGVLSVSGVVVDAGAAAKPLPGVEVRLFHTSDRPASHLTNDRGEFQFSVETPGRYFIQTARQGYRTDQSEQFWVARQGRTVVTMRQIKAGTFIVCE
jgi:hypothetical protein